MMEDLVDETTLFSGLENLETLSRRQCVILWMFFNPDKKKEKDGETLVSLLISLCLCHAMLGAD